MSRRLLVASAMAALLLVAVATTLILWAHGFKETDRAQELGEVVLDAVWIATGLVAWQRRPGNRVGLLMMAAGVADLVSHLYWSAPVAYALVSVLSGLQIPIFVHLFLAFPSGRPTTRFERRFVASLYCAWIALAPVALLLADTSDDCERCPSNPFRVVDSDAVASAFGTVASVLAAGVLVITVVLLVRKVRRAGTATRRAMGPVLLAITIAAVSLVPLVVAESVGSDLSDTTVGLISFLAWCAIPVAFLVGVLRTRLQRSAVADLVVELGAASRPDEVRDAIARALRDPSLELAFWLPANERYVDPAGRPLDPTSDGARAVTVLENDERRVAALVHDPALLDEPELLEAVGAAASLTLENARLQAELSAQLTEVRASRARIVEAGDAERRRLERDLHDGAQQRLLGVRLALQLARGRIADGDGSVDDLLTEADAEVGDALEELRALARGIHPAILTDEGLAPAIAALARRASVPIELNIAPERLPEPVEATAYFVASEALANVAKHARASRATIGVARTNGRVAIEVTDDGVGGADAEGTGLRGLRDRVEALDGQLEVETQAGAGTRVTAVIPCA